MPQLLTPGAGRAGSNQTLPYRPHFIRRPEPSSVRAWNLGINASAGCPTCQPLILAACLLYPRSYEAPLSVNRAAARTGTPVLSLACCSLSTAQRHSVYHCHQSDGGPARLTSRRRCLRQASHNGQSGSTT